MARQKMECIPVAKPARGDKQKTNKTNKKNKRKKKNLAVFDSDIIN